MPPRRGFAAFLACAMFVSTACVHSPKTTPPPHAELHFLDMPADASVTCASGCESLAVTWPNPTTMVLAPIHDMAMIELHFQAEGVDYRIQVPITPGRSDILFPAFAQ